MKNICLSLFCCLESCLHRGSKLYLQRKICSHKENCTLTVVVPSQRCSVNAKSSLVLVNVLNMSKYTGHPLTFCLVDFTAPVLALQPAPQLPGVREIILYFLLQLMEVSLSQAWLCLRVTWKGFKILEAQASPSPPSQINQTSPLMEPRHEAFFFFF